MSDSQSIFTQKNQVVVTKTEIILNRIILSQIKIYVYNETPNENSKREKKRHHSEQHSLSLIMFHFFRVRGKCHKKSFTNGKNILLQLWLHSPQYRKIKKNAHQYRWLQRNEKEPIKWTNLRQSNEKKRTQILFFVCCFRIFKNDDYIQKAACEYAIIK